MTKEFEDFVKSKVYVKFQTVNEKKLYWGNGLAGEAGEVCNEIKKEIRDELNRDERVKSEIGDVLFYLTMVAENHGFSLDDAMEEQIKKLSNFK